MNSMAPNAIRALIILSLVSMLISERPLRDTELNILPAGEILDLHFEFVVPGELLAFQFEG